MKILVTGIAGFLGSHLADYLLDRGHQVVGIDNMLGGEWDNVPDDAEYFNWDITSPNLQMYSELMQKCDIVYHCAAAPYEGVSSFAPGFICENIFSGSVNTFTAAIMANVLKIVNCSSMARYGIGDPPFGEVQTPRPVDPYGISKEAAERVLQNLSETHGFQYNTVVPHNIYGPRQRYYDPYRNVASIMINLILMGRQPIIYGDGKQTRCFSYITDCVEPLAQVGLREDVVGQTINIGPDSGEVTINELAEIIADIIGFKLDPIYMPDRPREVKHAHCSSHKARYLLDYEPKVSLRAGLEALVSWIELKGPKPFEYHFDCEIDNHKTPITWKRKMF